MKFVQQFLDAVSALFKQTPALAAGLVNLVVLAGAHFGFHLTATQVIEVEAALVTFLSGWLHQTTRVSAPGDHEKPSL
jgi:hypothetical protein